MKKKILLFAKVILSLLLLIYLFSIIPLAEIWKAIQSADIIPILIGLVLIIPVIYFSALETQYLTRIQGMTLRVFEIIKIHLASSFYGLFLPGSLSGGAVKWYKLSKHGKRSSSAAIIAFNRFLEILMILFIGILFSFPLVSSLSNRELIIIWLLIFLFTVVLYFLLLNKLSLNLIKKIFARSLLPAFIKEKGGKFLEAMQQFQNLRLKDHTEIIGLLMMYHSIGIISFFCFAKALNINVSILVIGWVRSVMALATTLPISFAGLGIREITLVYLLGQYGVTPGNSMALSFLVLFRSVLTSLIGGFFEFINFALSKQVRNNKNINTADDF